MAVLFLKKDAQELLKNKYVVVMGGSIQRSIYKDLIRILQGNTYLTDTLLRMKGEDSCLKDKLLDGGMRGTDKKGIGYREVRQYQTDFYFLQFVFMTRCYNSYVESVISKFSSVEQKPDVIIVNSCLWDITRYGKTPDISEYKKNLQRLFQRLKSALPDCLVIWNTNPAISHSPKGGVFIPGLDYLKDSMELHVLEANYYASKVAVETGHDVIDLHYFLRHQIHRRAEDGIHWDMTGHRRITNLLLTHIAQTWGIKLPEHIKMLKNSNETENKPDSLSTNENEMIKLDRNRLEGKSIFDMKLEPEKPKHDDIVEVEFQKQKQVSPKKQKKKKRRRNENWRNQRHSPVPTQTNPNVQVFNYHHQAPIVQSYQQYPAFNQQQTYQQPQIQTYQQPQIQTYQQPQIQTYQQPQDSFRQQNHPFRQQNIPFRQQEIPFQQQEIPFQQQEIPFQQQAIPFQQQDNPFRQQDFTDDNVEMYNFDNAQWQPYQEQEPLYGVQRQLSNIPEPRFNPYARGIGRGRRGMPY